MRHLLAGIPGAAVLAASSWDGNGVAAVIGAAAGVIFGYLARRDRHKDRDRQLVQAVIDTLQEDRERYRTELIDTERELSAVRAERRDLRHELGNAQTKVNLAMQTIGEQKITIDHLEAKVSELGGEP